MRTRGRVQGGTRSGRGSTRGWHGQRRRVGKKEERRAPDQVELGQEGEGEWVGEELGRIKPIGSAQGRKGDGPRPKGGHGLSPRKRGQEEKGPKSEKRNSNLNLNLGFCKKV